MKTNHKVPYIPFDVHNINNLINIPTETMLRLSLTLLAFAEIAS